MPDRDIYLKLDRVPGDSCDRYHVGWIQLGSFQWAVGNPPPTSSRPAPRVSEFTVTKLMDRSSTSLAKANAEGQPFSTALIEIVEPQTKRPKIRFDFTNLLIVSFSPRPSNPLEPGPVESITFSYTGVRINHNPVVDDDALDKILKAFGLTK